MGHALNKILKDIIMKYKYARGFDTPYVPGWDTHGMPIEHAAIKELGLNRNELDPLTLRRKCHDFALQWVDIQREDFKRLGVLGDWENPYITLHHSFEAEQIRVFGTMANKGYIYKGKRPFTGARTAKLLWLKQKSNTASKNSDYLRKMPLVKDNGQTPEAAKGKKHTW